MNSIFFWTSAALLVVAAIALVRMVIKKRGKADEEAEPEDNYPLW